MSAVRRLTALLQDSPTYGRDRATLISGGTIALTALLLNFAVVLLLLPLMLDPNDRVFRMLTENVEFGQLLALILLGGVTAFATVLIPLRLSSVFLFPRVEKYFDQIVLSGISPFRFVIGKAASQNLLLALGLFLLLPYLVLSLTLGGVKFEFFLAGVILVWLYCMQLSALTLWVTVCSADVFAAFPVIALAVLMIVLGCIPMPLQPFVCTPLPTLMQPVFSAIPELNGRVGESFLPAFVSSAACMSLVIAISLVGIAIGPLFGIIRENSTFGEVVQKGDSKRSQKQRLRLHIQRPSELAFFYENRSRVLHRNEGLFRWGIGFGGLLLLAAGAYAGFWYIQWRIFSGKFATPSRWTAYEFHAFNFVILGVGLALGTLLFSHSKNTTYMRIPFARGKAFEVSKLDTTAFLLLTAILAAAAFAVPFCFERFVAAPAGNSIFPNNVAASARGQRLDFVRICLEGNAIILIGGLALYAFQRLCCLSAWMKSGAYFVSLFAYFPIFGLIPIFVAVLFLEVLGFKNDPFVSKLVSWVAMGSPIGAFMSLLGELQANFPAKMSTIPFYIVNGILIASALAGIRDQGRPLRAMYLTERKPNGEPAQCQPVED
jgi:hypothetical protein